MKISSVVPVLALMAAQSVNAHTLFSELYVDGAAQGDGTCIRMPSDPNTATDPIPSLDSSDMACGVDGTKGFARVCSVDSGSVLSFEYRDWPDNPSIGSIDISHKGPCAVYLKKVDSAIDDQGTGDGWFKIWDEGYDESAGKWCTEKLIANNGHLSVNMPNGLQGGYYLVRPELLALHNADKGDPQFYVGCAQVWLNSTGSQLPQKTVSIPGYVDYNQPSTSFNIWNEPMALPYPIPGPAVYVPSSSAVGNQKLRVSQQQQTEGLAPSDCVVTNGNWDGIELDKYSDQAGCWNASTACWAQCKECYAVAPPTGNAGCKIWEDKCQNINDQCSAGNYNGPPNYMQNLNPPVKQVSLPAAVSAQNGDAKATAVTPPSEGNSLTVSTDGSCGNGVTCQGSSLGNCCSSHGYCGSSAEYCQAGCNSAFGTCSSGQSKRDEHNHMHVHKHAYHVGGDVRTMP
ncbi:glycoside hydrolase family 61 protein [Aureobasidium melanogenum CBS 110374]|uniref:AA9 family lytic polysaccharide monooxygenase n=1 Tax=Aureobasidium melanogenum (strain CBS 110374) TaxID=1043003 RepID=A0A074WT75_AURM1|nr:glycoside hydrolase family 61 protein [Aureobasidium melanogenum CBS 110374]KEQ65581.1 glycoside hydrolase family 61 protein [Aureobasidium melanogenum CBS 110374]